MANRTTFRRLGSLIVASALALWILLNATFVRHNLTTSLSRAKADSAAQARSLRIGKPPPPPPPPRAGDPDSNASGKVMSDWPNDWPIERVYRNVSPSRMHGEVGTFPNGTLVWEVDDYPENPANMAKLLREGGGFNLLRSDATELDRNVTDSRHSQCKALDYKLEDLPDACVVIVFYNEPFSTLFRSVHSVLNRSPPELLREIVLVDDGSDLDWIRTGGDNFIEEYIRYIPKTRLVRNPVRKGIVGARMAGIRACEASIFVILDSHVEVNAKWLEPLVQRLHEHPTHVLMPTVDGIDPETLEPRAGGIGCTLGFLWKLIEHSFDPNERSPPERRKVGPADFITSPTMAGGLFAANTDFFFEVGAYDELFEYWGTENLELSFRLWMCGGVLECAPCSRVYHIFRQGGVGYSSPTDAVSKNKMRTLTIWMDEFADLAWQTIGKPRVDFGDYHTRLEWRRQKGCRSFKWYLDNVNPESMVREVPRDVPFLGPMRNEGLDLCLDNMGTDYPGGTVGLTHCHGGRTQQFVYYKPARHISPIGNDETCLGHDKPNTTGWCHAHLQLWDYVEDTGQLVFVRNGECLSGKVPYLMELKPCNEADPLQRWQWAKYVPPNPFTPPPMPRLRGAE